jgi:hypothetical protein
MRRHAIWGMGGLVAVGLVAGFAFLAPGASGQQEAAAKSGGAVAQEGPKGGAMSREEFRQIREIVVKLRAEQDVAEIERDIAKELFRDLTKQELELKMPRITPRANKDEAEDERMRLDESRAFVAKSLQEVRRHLLELSTDYNRRRLELLDAEKALEEATKAGRR